MQAKGTRVGAIAMYLSGKFRLGLGHPHETTRAAEGAQTGLIGIV